MQLINVSQSAVWGWSHVSKTLRMWLNYSSEVSNHTPGKCSLLFVFVSEFIATTVIKQTTNVSLYIYLNIWQDTVYHTKPVCHNHWYPPVFPAPDELQQHLHTILYFHPSLCFTTIFLITISTNSHQFSHPSYSLLLSQYYMLQSARITQSQMFREKTTLLSFQSSTFSCSRILCS